MNQNSSQVTDALGRTFRKLRLSITSRCNYSCSYCTTGESAHSEAPGPDWRDLSRMVASIHRSSPLEAVRVTGGEPLLYGELESLLASLKRLSIPSVSITTNGSLLKKRIRSLQEAGLDSLNLSLDTLDPSGFRQLSRTGSLDQVLEGLALTLELGVPVKLNATIVRGENHDQILPLLAFAMSRKLEIRFIELMEMGHLYGEGNESLYPMSDILATVQSQYSIFPLPRKAGSTALRWSVEGKGSFGIIPNASDPFCHDCDRLRLSADGRLYGCLSVPEGFPIDPEKADQDLSFLLERALGQKKTDRFTGSGLSMRSIGG